VPPTEIQLRHDLTLEVAREAAEPPSGSDAPPISTLRLKQADGKSKLLDKQAVSYATFGERVAYVDLARRLFVQGPDGARLAIAESVSARPAWSASGDLLYVVQGKHGAEIRARSTSGSERVLVDTVANAGVLAPQVDGSLFFVGAKSGGVAGLWRVTRSQAVQCLTNCELRTGTPWGEAFLLAPGEASQIQVSDGKVTWKAPSGELVSVSLPEEQ
jgi:hypothetical protein